MNLLHAGNLSVDGKVFFPGVLRQDSTPNVPLCIDTHTGQIGYCESSTKALSKIASDIIE